MIRGSAAYAVLPENSVFFASTSKKALPDSEIRNNLD
jgi:hypothetical protein